MAWLGALKRSAIGSVKRPFGGGQSRGAICYYSSSQGLFELGEVARQLTTITDDDDDDGSFEGKIALRKISTLICSDVWSRLGGPTVDISSKAGHIISGRASGARLALCRLARGRQLSTAPAFSWLLVCSAGHSRRK
ncbi:conserved hypothetical protein [Trichinella spiralis]|uniref:hypothetical protein n=1 Tax=Trichinella spiralis TaxID=6334 RepID=UPI0001EFC7A8|nr:conserved hypothetical protein [Trichinella spiralis]